MGLRSTSELFPSVGSEVPRFGNRFTQRIGMFLLKTFGWKVRGELPNRKHLMITVAPHTSNWDFVFCMFVVLAMGIKLSFMMKKEAFFWPFKSLFMALGGIPIDRKASGDTVSQVCDWYDTHEELWVAITPEGSRSKREKWKTGFARIAKQANVPVMAVGINFPDKTFYLEPLRTMDESPEEETRKLQELITSKYRGKRQDLQ